MAAETILKAIRAMMRPLMTLASLALVAPALLVGCGSTASSPDETDHDAATDAGGHIDLGKDAGTGAEDTGTGTTNPEDTGAPSTDGGAPAGNAGKWTKLPPPPELVNSDGGVLTSPVVIAIFFQNDDQTLLPTLEQFYTDLGASTYWAVASEYGVGPATAMNIVIPEDAPATIDDSFGSSGGNTALETWLLGEISSNVLPGTSANTTYMINYPSTTTVTANGMGCVDFDGYHTDLTDAANNLISYGVVPRCTDPGSTTEVTFTSTVSHEVMEAATDPWPDYSPGWAQVDNAHLFFDEANEGTEVADMCENDPEAYYQFPGLPFTVQRVWSNKSVLAGHDPCVPEIPNTVFFNAVPELPDTGLYNYYGTNVTVSSVHIPVGGTGTVYIDLYSDGTTPDWDVTVLDGNYFNTGDQSQALLTVDQPVTTGNNGTRLAVNLTVKSAGSNANGEVPNTELFAIVSSQGTSETAPAHYWYGIVTN